MAIPDSRARRSNARRSCRTRSRNALGSGGRLVARSRGSNCSRGAAAVASGETLMAGGAVASNSDGGGTAGAGGRVGAAGRRPPGIGRITVRSLSAGSAKGLSLTWPPALAVVLGQAVVLHDPFQGEAIVRI